MDIQDKNAVIEYNDMQLYSYFSFQSMMNTYVIWRKDTRDAILIDPVVLDVGLFEILEGNNLEITSVLLTHAHETNFHGLKTIPKIYHDVTIYGGSSRIYDLSIKNIKEPGRIYTAGFTVDPIFLPGHHSDSLVYKIEELLFTGDILSAGNLVLADANYGRSLLCQCIHEYLFALSDHSLILPLFGPPSTIGIERKTNTILNELC